MARNATFRGANLQYIAAPKSLTGLSDVTIASAANLDRLQYSSSAGKWLDVAALTTPQIEDSSANHQYIFAVSELAADRTVTLPLLTGNDTFVFASFAATLTNKTLTSPVINTGVSGSAILDQDDMSGNSATQLATQQSIKAYVDAQIATEDTLAELNDTTISGPASNDLLQYSGSAWVDRTYAEAGIASLTGSETLTNKTLSSPVITTGDINTPDIDGGTVDAITSLTVANNVDVGSYTVRASGFLADGLTAGQVVYTGTDGVLSAEAALAYNASTNTLTATNIAGTLTTAAQTAITSVGALSGGSIASGFGAIDTGSSAITTTGTVTGGTLAGTLSTAAQGSVTSLGTLTALTVDNIAINGATIGHTGDTDLITLASTIVTVAGEVSMTTLDIGGTNVTSTAAELNLVDGSSANSVVNSKAVIYGSSGELAGTLSTAAQTNITSVGALSGGSISSGFGNIDIGASSLAGGSLDVSEGNISNVGDISLDSISADATTIEITADVVITGTTPLLTIGDGGTEDAGLLLDGAAIDYHFALDDTHDGVFLGSTATIGSNTAQAWAIHANGPLIAFGSTPSSSFPFKVYQSHARSANAGNLQWFSSTLTLTGDAGSGSHVGCHIDNTLVLADDDAELANVYQLRVDGAQITQPDPAGTISGNTAAIYIPNAYTGTVGGENYSLFIDNGAVRIDKSLWVESTPTEGSAGEQLTSGGAATAMTWAAAGSLGKFKETIDELSPADALAKVLSWTPRLFRYRDDAEVTTHDTDTVYTGVYGEDAPEVMHHEGKIFSPVSAFGYTVGAVRAMSDRIATLESRLDTV